MTDVKPTKVRLAEALQEIPGMYPAMLERAIDGVYDDYETELDYPQIQLITDLRVMHAAPTTGPKAKAAIEALIVRVMGGEFDGTKEEAEAWGRSEEGREVMRVIMREQRR